MLLRVWLLAGCCAVVMLFAPLSASAAEVLQVRSATLLQVGDQNRSYGVEIACLAVSPEQANAATDWLRRDLPRRTRVNLKPRGSTDGQLLARVERLDRGTDVADDLVAAGFGQIQPACQA